MNKPTLTPIELQCAIDVPVNSAHPKRRAILGYQVDRYFAVREATRADLFNGWAVIHIQMNRAGLIKKVGDRYSLKAL